jgi:prophage antirepressor-like protein
MNELTVYKFKQSDVRILKDEKGEPWFVAKDVCDILEFSGNSRPLRSLDDQDKATVPIKHGEYEGNQVIVNESGLYKLIFKSRIPKAKEFQNWVTREVLPSIRKTGVYVTPGAGSIDTLHALKILIDKQIELEQRMDKYEAKQQAVTAILAPVKEISQRTRINQVVRDYAYKNSLKYEDCWHQLYYEFRLRYGIDLPTRASNRNATGVQVAEEIGCTGDLLSLAVYLFGK